MMKNDRRTMWLRAAAAIAGALILAGTFLLYLKPDFVVTVANSIFYCQ